MRCSKCGCKIERGNECYFHAKVVCQICFEKIRIKENSKERVAEYWKNWIKR